MKSGAAGVSRVAMTVRGTVQGVGFRPFVQRMARFRGLGGWVRNAGAAVQIEVEGPEDAVQAFAAAIEKDRPSAASVRALVTEPRQAIGQKAFFIEASTARDGAGAQPIAPDKAPCERCLREIQADGRRAGYPFTSCTACGPRYSVVLSVPYDRARTTMEGFELCELCRAEYADTEDPRGHAQALACPACGPRLSLRAPDGASVAEGASALDGAVDSLRRGLIVAMKGVGGYQLLADARDEAVVAELRRRKRRDDKPFAVLFKDVGAAMVHCLITEEERRELASKAAPIVLCASLASSDLAPSVAMGSPLTGAMLPASPLHHLIARAFGGPLVCTSGNPSGEPLCTEDAEAIVRLGPIAAVILSHDRPIARACDDSVVRVTPFGATALRRARGLVPSPITRPRRGPAVLALGGHQKATIAIAIEDEIAVSQHIGDLDSAQGAAHLRRTVADLIALLRAEPQIIGCDLHPDYVSTRLAEELSTTLGAPLERVQHHHAHVAAVMAEHGLSGPVLGFAWDGAGDGGDGTLWGGEALLCEGAGFVRAAHLRPFSLPGGGRAMREPRRSAAGVLAEIGEIDRAPGLSDIERRAFAVMISRGVNAPRTTSVGRLFDAVAALAGLRFVSSYEGQAAMMLEHAAADDPLAGPYPIDVRGSAPPYIIDHEPLIRAVLRDRAAGVSPCEIAARFHAALAEAALTVAQIIGVRQIALGGGCFQNARLLGLVKARLEARGFDVRAARRVPTNDGGLSLGQAHILTERAHVSGRPG